MKSVKVQMNWSVSAGGTEAIEGKNSYSARGSFGEYHIWPPTYRRRRYALQWANTKSLPAAHGGLWHELGTFSSPQAAKKYAKDHASALLLVARST